VPPHLLATRCPSACKVKLTGTHPVNNIIYIVGLIVIILIVLGWFGLR
jgi:hypothetical protein